MRRGVRQRAAPAVPGRIQLLVLDVDGVLTDGRLWFSDRGEALKAFHVRDGHGIKQLRSHGVRIAVISGRRSAAVLRRCRELGITIVVQSAADKLAALARIARRLRIPLDRCACVGDDSPDVAVMKAVGLAFAVADAHGDARHAAHYLTALGGGNGAVREVCDWLVAQTAS